MKTILAIFAVLIMAGWTWPWSTTAELSLPYDHDLRLLAVDAARHPALATVWKVTPVTAGTVTPDTPLAWTVVFAPSQTKQICQVWSRTGTLPWRKVAIRLIDPTLWLETIAPGESWVHGSR